MGTGKNIKTKKVLSIINRRLMTRTFTEIMISRRLVARRKRK
jgi:hypothetical protein